MEAETILAYPGCTYSGTLNPKYDLPFVYMKFLTCYTGKWSKPWLSREELVDLFMPVWEGGTGCLLEVPCMDKSMDRRSAKGAFAQSFYWGKFVGRFTWSFEVQGRLLGSYSQSRELHGHSLYNTNLNNKYSMRCAGSESPFKLPKYVFCSVLHSFVLNDPTDGHTSSKSSGRIDFDFRAGIFFSDIQSTFILAFFHLLTQLYLLGPRNLCSSTLQTTT